MKKLLLFIFFVYSIASLVLYFAQDSLLFLPDKLPENHRFRMGEEVNVEVEDGISLNCLWIKDDNSKGVILYLHGTKGSNARCTYQASTMLGLGYDIFMPDYRGYGKSDGKIISENQLYSDVQKVYDHVKTQYSEDKIILVGYSLGTGMASYLASKNNPQALILNSAFCSITALKNRRLPIFPDFLVKYPLNNKKHLKDVSVPTYLFHGTDDELIPYEHMEHLTSTGDHIKGYPLLRTGHRRAIFSDIFRGKLRDILLGR